MPRPSLILSLLLSFVSFVGACAQGLDLGHDESDTSSRQCPGCPDGGGGLVDGSALPDGQAVVPSGSGKVALLDSRIEHAMAPLGSSIILFGGNNAAVLGDTWAWTAGAWAKRSPAKSPSPRRGHSMAAFGNKVLLFGGRDTSGAALDETWEYDGVTWTQRSPAHRPSDPLGATTMAPRGSEVVLYSPAPAPGPAHVHVWDGTDWTELPGAAPSVMEPMLSTRGNRVVLHGTRNNGTGRARIASVWELDGTTWGPSADAPLLSNYGGAWHMGALAPLGNRVVLSGIASPSAVGQADVDTWEWDGAAWTDRNVVGSTGAPPRNGHAMAQAGGKVVFFGGAGAGDYNDTWTWDASAWSLQKNVAPGGGTAVMGLRAGKLVRVIPRDPSGSRWFPGSTWEWDGASWSEKHPTTVPVSAAPPFMGAASRGDVLVLFTVVNSGPESPYEGATWEWDGVDWTRKNPAHSPVPYRQFGLASLGSRVVYFGGSTGSEAFDKWNHTWEWDGVDWTEKTTTVKPSARVAPAMATYGNKVVLFGGGSLAAAQINPPYPPRDDTWEWDGTVWTQRSPQVSPEPRQNASAALAAVGSKLVLFGGESAQGAPVSTAWEWDGTVWTPRTGALPPARTGGVLAPFADRAVLYGGAAPSLGLALTDMWMFAP